MSGYLKYKMLLQYYDILYPRDIGKQPLLRHNIIIKPIGTGPVDFLHFLHYGFILYGLGMYMHVILYIL